MRRGELEIGSQKLKGFKAYSLELVENQMIIRFMSSKKERSSLVLEGIIGFKDLGLIGKALADYRVEDRGSYREIFISKSRGENGFHCKYMEGKVE